MPLYAARTVDLQHSETIPYAGEQLRAGKLVAFPTETVYGLGANALNASAVANIFEAKRRPNTDPLIVHVPVGYDLQNIFDYNYDCNGNKDIEALVRSAVDCLCNSFWPGPLTLIYRAKSVIPSLVTSGTGFVGVRSPKHIYAQLLLKAAGMYSILSLFF
jgi:L-threonylcarbamoyladenylate synthase